MICLESSRIVSTAHLYQRCGLLSMSATALDLACQRDELQEICHENEK
jgi:hypothetical protein